MLKNLPETLTPELFAILAEMGHGDELVIADANYPARANAKRLYVNKAMDSLQMLDLVTKYLPLDTFVACPAALMAVVPGDDYVPDLWPQYLEIIRRNEREIEVEYLERQAFYARGREAFAVIATGERGRYGNIILKKGIV